MWRAVCFCVGKLLFPNTAWHTEAANFTKVEFLFLNVTVCASSAMPENSVARKVDAEENAEDVESEVLEPGEVTVDDTLEVIGFQRTQGFLFMASGFIWASDAMSVMLMSFLGPAESADFVCVSV